MNKRFFTAFLFVFFAAPLSARGPAVSVALVADRAAFAENRADLDSYAAAIERGGKKVFIIEDVWEHPDSIRLRLEKLHNENGLEGVVLIGDIPVPMIRDAQHLTTAFKMDQARDWKQSSVPSDRFYDDFDLRFDYLKSDADRPLYHYYSLRADSPQFISCDIYSARVRPPVEEGRTRREAIAGFLAKAVEAKKDRGQVRRALHFAGHGYNSESIEARIGENRALRRHFPALDSDPRASLVFIDFDRDRFVKQRLMSALADPSLDVAVLHHHGSPSAQYLSKMPYTNSLAEYIEFARMFVRNKIRDSGDTTARKAYYMTEYGIPQSWVDDASDPAVAEADELFAAGFDLTLSDLDGYIPGAKFVMLDACFNGSFHRGDYVAARWIFNPGGTVAVRANSVNVLQDTWPTELIGLLGEGVCIGNWAKNIATLESHIIGDPTFAFVPAPAAADRDLDRAVARESRNPEYWRKLMKRGGLPSDIRALAMSMLAANGAIGSDELLDILSADGDPVVRLEALTLLRKRADETLADALILGMRDNYELTARLSALYAAKTGDPRLLSELARLYADPATSERLVFHIRTALEMYAPDEAIAAIKEARSGNSPWPADEQMEMLAAQLERSRKAVAGDIENLHNDSLPFRARRNSVTPQRNKCNPLYLDAMLGYLADGADDELRLVIAETLGWYVYSAERGRIVGFLTENTGREQNPAVGNEMTKTLNRLTNPAPRIAPRTR